MSKTGDESSHSKSNAGIGGVGPFELDGVVAELLGLPGADVADLAVIVVVPALTRNGIGDGFAEFMGRSRRERGEGVESTETAGAARKGHHGIVDAAGGSGVVIAAEIFAGGGRALLHRDAGREIQEIERIFRDGGKRAGGDLCLNEFLDSGVG